MHYLSEAKSLTACVDYTITQMDNMHLDGSYDSSKHAAQLVWYLALSSSKGGVIWFGIMLYDNRMDKTRNEAPGFSFKGGKIGEKVKNSCTKEGRGNGDY